MKTFILITIIVIGGLVLYFQNTKTPTITQDSGIINSEKDSSEKVVPVVPKADSATNTEEPILDNDKVIDLSGKGLTQSPKYVFGKTDTEKLDLSNNKMSGALQAEIRHLQNLMVLDLSNNNFTGVPAEIGQIKNLSVLDLSNNQLTGLPLELGNLSNLKILNLKGNDYSKTDLGLIKEKLPSGTIIEVD